MPKKTLSKAKGQRLLEDTKQRLRLQQEARTTARIEQLDIEACERLRRQLQLEHLELNGELECSETNTARQYTLYLSDVEEDAIPGSVLPGQYSSTKSSTILLLFAHFCGD